MPESSAALLPYLKTSRLFGAVPYLINGLHCGSLYSELGVFSKFVVHYRLYRQFPNDSQSYVAINDRYVSVHPGTLLGSVVT